MQRFEIFAKGEQSPRKTNLDVLVENIELETQEFESVTNSSVFPTSHSQQSSVRGSIKKIGPSKQVSIPLVRRCSLEIDKDTIKEVSEELDIDSSSKTNSDEVASAESISNTSNSKTEKEIFVSVASNSRQDDSISKVTS